MEETVESSMSATQISQSKWQAKLAKRFRVEREKLALEVRAALEGNEYSLFRLFVATSFCVHVLVIIASMFSWPRPALNIDEWAMDADLISDLNTTSPTTTSLPDAKVAEEAKAPKDMLPQLPKRFEVDEATQNEEKTFTETNNEKSTVAKTEEEKKFEFRKDDEAQNRVKKDDALRRLALERLREMDKIAKTRQAEAPKESALAKLRDEVNQAKDGVNAGAGGAAFSALKNYRGSLQASVRRNYSLPEAYNFKSANMKVTIAIVVNEKGDVISLGLHESSGDSVFDDMALQAVKKSVPLPTPPAELVGEKILMQFKP